MVPPHVDARWNRLARNLKRLQEQKGLNQKQFADFLGISASYLCEIYAGVKTGERQVLNFADRLGVTVEELLAD